MADPHALLLARLEELDAYSHQVRTTVEGVLQDLRLERSAVPLNPIP